MGISCKDDIKMSQRLRRDSAPMLESQLEKMEHEMEPGCDRYVRYPHPKP